MYTVNNYLRNIKVLFTCLYDSEVIKNNPTVQIRAYKHSRRPKSEIIREIDLNKLIKALDLTSYAEYRDYVILHPEVKELLDSGVISKTSASKILVKLSEKEQRELLEELGSVF